MKIIYALAEYLSIMVGFNSETQFGVQSPEALFQKFGNVVIHD
jgi:hypothetical protein